MHDIRNGQMRISYISRATFARLGVRRIDCAHRDWDSFSLHLTGSCNYHFQDGTDICSCKEALIYLPYGANYTLDVLTPDFSYIVCDFRATTDEPRHPFIYQSEKMQIYEKLFQKLQQTFCFTTPDSHANSLAILFQIYAQIIRDSHPQYTNGTTKKLIEHLASYVCNHVQDPNLSVRQLTELSDLSETHLRRLFQNMYGMPPSKYIMQARILHAKSLMGMKELTLQDISAQCGFASYTYFCTIFKAVTGLNPSVYRQKFFPVTSCRKTELQ